MLRPAGGAIVGQAGTLIPVLLLGGVQLIVLGISGEYLGRIHDEVRARPLYSVRDLLEECPQHALGEAAGERQAQLVTRMVPLHYVKKQHVRSQGEACSP